MMRLPRLGLWILATSLAACSPTEASADLDLTLDAQPRIVEGSAETGVQWAARVKAASAPAGDYLLFAALERPTATPAALAAVDLAACAVETCEVPGVGRLVARATLAVEGPLDLLAGFGRDYTSAQFFTLARAESAATTPPKPVEVNVEVSVTENKGGCSGPDAPELTAASLGAGS